MGFLDRLLDFFRKRHPTPTPTPIPAPALPRLTSGRAVIELTGLDRLPLRPGLDNVIVATLCYERTGEPMDRSLPVLELSLRGTSPAPCLAKGCKGAAGLVVRYDANLAYSDTLPWTSPTDEHQSLELSHGRGLNYHRRLALGPLGPGGTLRVSIEWDRDGLSVSTPVEAAEWGFKTPGCFGLGQLIVGAPGKRGKHRGWGWVDYSGTRYGIGARAVEWQSVGQQHELVRVPVPAP